MMKRLWMVIATAMLLAVPVFARGSDDGTTTSLALAVVILGCGIAGFYCYRQKIIKNYGSEGTDKPYPFQEKATLNLTHSKDTFVREYTTVVRKPSAQNNHHGGGRPHGGRPGGGRR